ncbi:MAG: lasso peptide biosynthesis B2 protein [Proteobacteria bacterium]|nr:lasso peptide biosynthesis B2 protein [Pseudomonadota bacterium]
MIGKRLRRIARVAALRAEAIVALGRVRRRGRSIRYDKAATGVIGTRDAGADAAAVDELAAAVAFAARRPGTTCVDRATVLWGMLDRRGLPARMRIGYRYAAGVFEAHAWVECGGHTFGEVPADGRSYRPFDDAVVPRPAK